MPLTCGIMDPSAVSGETQQQPACREPRLHAVAATR
jgi:hypothetical protein